MSSTIILPKILEIGAGALTKTADILSQLGCHNPCIITDKIMVQLGYCGQLTQVLEKQGLSYDIFDQTMPEPTDGGDEIDCT
ncbi:MAG: alcohol dehydrogenase class IV [Phenylobacterium sp.]|jgi:alcohol dehydrogenase class IV